MTVSEDNRRRAGAAGRMSARPHGRPQGPGSIGRALGEARVRPGCRQVWEGSLS